MRDAVFGWASRLLMRQNKVERSPQGTSFDDSQQYMLVEDRGSDVTIFCFAGLAVLFAGLPTFEFRRLLKQHGDDYNLVFFRDIRRSAYHLTPSGEVGGLAFYEGKVREVMARLGSSYNVALGASAGGGAAFYFGTRCGMDQIVTFSPGFPGTVYIEPKAQLHTYFNLKKLVTDPKAYIEILLVTLGCLWVVRSLVSRIGDNYWNVRETYRTFRTPRPRSTIFYGAGCRPDANQARMMAEFPEVKTVALPCGNHNCASHLKQRGALGEAILAEIREGMEAAGYNEGAHRAAG